jgi:hypothetical protein
VEAGQFCQAAVESARARMIPIPSANSGPLSIFGRRGGQMRLSRLDEFGQMRVNGVEATNLEIATARNLPAARRSRSHTDRSKYSPKECFLKGKR